MYGYVYKISFPNGKCYIGSHKSKTFDENYWGSATSVEYWKKLFLVGKENVKREILCWCEDDESLRKMEGFCIANCKSEMFNIQLPKDAQKLKRKDEILQNLEYIKTLKNIPEGIKICPICGKEFIPEKRHPDQKYCSKACASRASRAGLGTKKIWNKGLTKETDERIKNIGNKLKGRDTWSKGIAIKKRKPYVNL